MTESKMDRMIRLVSTMWHALSRTRAGAGVAASRDSRRSGRWSAKTWSAAILIVLSPCTLLLLASAPLAIELVTCDLSDAQIASKLGYPRVVEIELPSTIVEKDRVPVLIIGDLKRQGKLDHSIRRGVYRLSADSYDARVVTPVMDLNYDLIGVRIKLLNASIKAVHRSEDRKTLDISLDYGFLPYFQNSDSTTPADVAVRFRLPRSLRATINVASCAITIS